jgi:AmmeMemoRadiSam system protein B
MTSIRPAAVAGSFYPADAAQLRALLDHCFHSSPLGPGGKLAPHDAMIAGMVPHAGPIYSGPCAAHLYASLNPALRRVIILGVNHRGRGHRAALSPWQSWSTPLGEVAVDEELNANLESRIHFLKREPRAHADEHSIEVQLPFLQRMLADLTITPISLAHISGDECAEIGAVIAAYIQQHDKTLVLASSDLSHYLSPRQTEELDRLALDQVLALNPDELLKVTAERHITMCGVIPTAIMLFAANALGVKRATLLKHCHSGEVEPMAQVVGYASVAVEF